MQSGASAFVAVFWVLFLRRCDVDHQPSEEFSFYLPCAASLVNESQVKAAAPADHPNYELQQLVLILGATMTVLNEAITKENAQLDSITFGCLQALKVLSGLVEFIPGKDILHDFVEYVLTSLRRILLLSKETSSSPLKPIVLGMCVELYVSVSSLLQKNVNLVTLPLGKQDSVFTPKPISRKWLELRAKSHVVPPRVSAPAVVVSQSETAVVEKPAVMSAPPADDGAMSQKRRQLRSCHRVWMLSLFRAIIRRSRIIPTSRTTPTKKPVRMTERLLLRRRLLLVWMIRGMRRKWFLNRVVFR